MSSPRREGVLAIADWDADGAVAAAVLLYAQKYEGVYPIKKRIEIDLKPSEPYSAFKDLNNTSCYDYLVILDIPIISISQDALREYKKICRETKIIYVDHHLSTHRELHKLTDLIDEPLVGYVPTSKILYDKILLEGAKKNPRLEMFVSTIYFMDQGLTVPVELRNIMRLLASISKYMAHKKDYSLWIRVVEWLAPRYIHSYLDPEALNKIYAFSKEIDQELKEIANELAISSQKLGLFRYIDARNKWRRKGASALASALYRIFKTPTIVVVSDPHDREMILVIIKYPGRAYKIAKILEEKNLAKSIGGHPSLAIIKTSNNDLGTLLNTLRNIRSI